MHRFLSYLFWIITLLSLPSSLFAQQTNPQFETLTSVESTLELVQKNPNTVVFLSIGASYCPACIKEIAELVILQKNNPDLKIYSLLTDDSDISVNRFVTRSQSPFPTYKITATVASAFHVTLIPQLVIYGTSGKLYTITQGLLPYEKLQELYNKAKKQ